MKDAVQTFLKMLRYYPRVLRVVWEASPRYTLWAFLLTIASAAMQPLQIWISKVLIDQIIGTLQAPAPATGLNWTAVITPIAAILLVWIVGGVCGSLSDTVQELASFQVKNHAENMLLSKAAQLDVAFFETPAFFDRMENARRELWRAQNLSFFIFDATSNLFSLAAMLALLLRLHPFTIVLLVLTTAPAVYVRAHHGAQSFRIWTNRASPLRMINYLSGLLGSRDAVKEIRLFELHEPILERHRHFWHAFFRDIEAMHFARERLNLVATVLSLLGTATVWIYAVVQATLARITVGDVALVFQAADGFRERLSRLFGLVGMFYEHSLFIGNFFDFLDLTPDAVEGSLHRNGREGTPLPLPNPLRQGIEFRHVSFRYPGMERWMLRDLSFTIHPGETVALVGENGAGKTTLVKLLARLYDPTEGEILLDGRNLHDYDLTDLRRQIGVIFQDFMRYSLTARENIGFGQVVFVEDLSRVGQAADKGGARPVVDKLSKGFETVLGRTFDEGVDLSGGEWQKLGLSRGFMREAQILILDEPTASLDALAEYEVYRRFAELTEGKTTVFISHRFSTVRMAQHILVLQDGQLIEEGTHDQLMALAGQYAKMFNTQAERYR